MFFGKLFMIFLFLIIGGIFVYTVIKTYAIYKLFTDYLVKIGDIQTLEMVNYLNPFGQRKLKSIFIIYNLSEILTEKYEQTNDENYLLFFSKYNKFLKYSIVLAILLFALFIFYMINFY